MQHPPRPPLGRVIALGLLAVLSLAGCTGTPDFEQLRAEVIPETPLSPGPDAELRVRLEATDGSGTLAETRTTGPGSSPWAVVLRVDRRALERAGTAQLHAELREAGRVTHASPEPVPPAGGVIELPLAPRR
ncbi:hypothetical protein [Halomonas sp. C05BenzN]|uniref:hypothetical protein n=1 Tax=Halomonas sp. C05BenzN TaxID=3411041 RepID=UPI003B95FDFC